MTDDILVIPDVHGRTFWKEAVEKMPDNDIIFLGDYHDPYPAEGISESTSLVNFREIMDFARARPNVQLLLGNHDLHYLCSFGEQCRLDFANSLEIHTLLYDNLWHMKLAVERTIAGRNVLFSHAPVLNGWIPEEARHLDISDTVEFINAMTKALPSHPWNVEPLLGQIGRPRGGSDDYGSPVWADISEIANGGITERADYSVFGHTQVYSPIITPSWADLDCRQAFRITRNFEILPV